MLTNLQRNEIINHTNFLSCCSLYIGTTKKNHYKAGVAGLQKGCYGYNISDLDIGRIEFTRLDVVYEYKIILDYPLVLNNFSHGF